MSVALTVDNLSTGYGRIEVLRAVSLTVARGEVVALVGANGAGKSTLLNTLIGAVRPWSGAIALDGAGITGLQPEAVVSRGLALVPERRQLFGDMTVEENLIVGAHLQTRAALAERREFVFGLFPKLHDRREQVAGYLSGGEQQMAAIGRALMSRPRLLALDEPSLGLAPKVVSEIFAAIRRLREETGTTILLVEQNATRALAIADYAYIMENGRVVLDGTPQALSRNADVREFYLGLNSQSGRISMRDVKHYRRRKRWLS